MLPDAVKSQAVAIRTALSSHGWTVVEVEQPFEDEWWVAEIWRIESDWSPQGVWGYLTFLVDPQGGRNDVWAVCGSRQRPTEGPHSSDPTMTLMKGWQQELPSFINDLSQLRVEPTEEAE
jgi:hypothetical protein